MKDLIADVKSCTICKDYIDPNPVMSASTESRVVIIGQAPGSVVHASGVPWEDKSGDRLRDWMGIDKDTFYNPNNLALIPMGFCYPGKGKSGDLPPRPECAPKWHPPLLNALKKLELTILIGSYAQGYYLEGKEKSTLTETVQNFNQYLPKHFVLPHPSPRNNIWLRKNSWFEAEVIPTLRQRVAELF